MIIAWMVVFNNLILKRSHASWNQNSGFQYLPLFIPAVLLPKSRPAYLRNIWISRSQWFSVGFQCSFIERRNSLWESSLQLAWVFQFLLDLLDGASPPPKVCHGCQLARFGGRRFVHFSYGTEWLVGWTHHKKERNLGDSWGDDYCKRSIFLFWVCIWHCQKHWQVHKWFSHVFKFSHFNGKDL